TVLRIDRSRLAVTDSEELGIKARDVVDECAPPTYRASGHAGFGVVVFVRVPAVKRDFGDQVVTSQQRFPQQFGGSDPSGKSAGHPDDSNRGHPSLIHSRSPRGGG